MTEPTPPSGKPVAVHDLTGTTVGRFAVRGRLGAGGMGEVYRAEDTKLRRPVALKRVSPGIAQDQSYRQRLLREAERASSLSHEHIAAVYDVLEENGEIFVVMEYVEGQTLRERMKEPFSEKEFFEIAIQCTEALVAAQAKGIVHRDIKPENIMLSSSGNVKVLDFGVARRMPQPGAGGTTETSDSSSSRFSGTPAYMAPEVLLEKESDGRADIFSLGVVLYEALTGHHPFRADSFMATCDRILRESPAPVTQVNPTVSSGVGQLLGRMLAKSPSDRFRNAQELLQDLRRLQGGSAISYAVVQPATVRWAVRAAGVLAVVAALAFGAMQPSVQRRVKSWLGVSLLPEARHLAVLPFEVVGGDPRSKAFCDGLVATVTAKLTQLTERGYLQVVPASEVRAAGIGSAEQARQQLGVNLVLMGTLHEAGGQVRISYALVDTASRRQRDADTVTAPVANTFELEDRVVSGVLRMLDVDLQPAEQRAMAAHGTQVVGAFDYYLQGRGYLENFDRKENIDSAIRVFEQALRLDSDYALAHTGLGEAFWRKYEATHDSAWVAQARNACKRGLAIDPDLAAARRCLGMLLNGTGEYEAALAEWQKALQLEKTSDEAYRGLALAYEQLGRLDRVEATYQRAIDLRPHYWASYNYLGVFYYRQARYGDAEKMFSRVVALVPDSYRGYSNLGAIYMLQGRYAEALRTLQRSVDIRATSSGYSNLATAFFHLKNYDEAARTYERATQVDPGEYMLWWNLGDAYYWDTGRRPEAAKAYRKAIALGKEKLAVNPKDIQVLSVLAICHAMLGDRPAALEALRRAQTLAPADPEVQFRAAVVHTHLGDAPAALDTLEKALAAGYSVARARDDPVFDGLRDHPRFRGMLSKK
jgi:tetratricopeptide (TPR) repeat protein/TolB-like protein/predicted Ser/Thr protein kinase